MMRRCPLPVSLVALVCAGLPLVAGQEQDSLAPSFKAGAELVVLHVNVFDGRSDAVANLPQSAFHVSEDDQTQPITFFNSSDVPVAVGLVVDNSSSMITRRPLVLAGRRAFVESSHPEDELFAVVFNEDVRRGLPDGVPFTRSQAQLAAALGRFPAGGKTALYDAVIAALNHAEEAPHQKRVLVVLSDGGDNASRHSKQQMLSRALASDTIVYTVSSKEYGAEQGDPAVLKTLAALTGGVAYFPRSEKDIVANLREIAGNIRRGYSIGYVPPASPRDGRYHRVKVMVRVPGRKNLRVHTRDGYASDYDGSR